MQRSIFSERTNNSSRCDSSSSVPIAIIIEMLYTVFAEMMRIPNVLSHDIVVIEEVEML